MLELVLESRLRRRDIGRHLRHTFAHARHALKNDGLQFLAFAPTAGHKIVQSLSRYGERFGQQCFLVDGLVTENTGPAQHLTNGERPRIRHAGSHLPIERTELSQQVLVELQLLRAAGCRHEIDPALDLASAGTASDGLAQCGLRHAQLVANAEMHVKKTGIDAFKFKTQGTMCNIARFGRVTSHALNHGMPTEGAGADRTARAALHAPAKPRKWS